jgi:mannose-6-phosphate isomerase-like protein (cupin superfamily)
MKIDSDATVHVPAGKDRFHENELRIWGLIPLSIKVSGKDTGGRFFIFEHREMGKGGPPRHVHHDQDEWFYVLQGEYAFEVGERKFRLCAGESLLAPRKLPHGWANVGSQPGTLMTLVSPVGSFETFLLETTKHSTLLSPEEVAQAFAAHDMTVVGPPLDVD